MALRNLHHVWGAPPPLSSSDADYWAAFRRHYGFHAAPDDNDGLPLGVRKVDAGTVTFDCRMCHADVVAGQLLIGGGNSLLDFQGLMDDLDKLAQLAAMLGFPAYANPIAGQQRTGAAGATDATGLGLWLSTRYASPPSGLHTTLGYQTPAPWWNLRYKQRIYADGSGQVAGVRTMMAMFLAFGMSLAELQALEPQMEDVRHDMLSLEPPAWPFTPPAADAVARGARIFGERCAGCHGRYGGPDAHYPETIVTSGLGTDPTRAAALTSVETTWINASWFAADHPMQATGGYLAPPLTGVWASAPYFHNGSVPDLRGVLRPSARPARWRRTGAGPDDYDPSTVGWRYITPASASAGTIEDRRTYDTTRAGLDNGGHAYGDALSDAELADLLDYLKTL